MKRAFLAVKHVRKWTGLVFSKIHFLTDLPFWWCVFMRIFGAYFCSHRHPQWIHGGRGGGRPRIQLHCWGRDWRNWSGGGPIRWTVPCHAYAFRILFSACRFCFSPASLLFLVSCFNFYLDLNAAVASKCIINSTLINVEHRKLYDRASAV